MYTSAVGSTWSPWSMASCCSQLASSLGSLVSYPGTTAYNTSQASYWSLQESDLNPACVFKPSIAEHVAQAVTILANPSNQACQFAVKGQTHAPAAGFANIEGGVTIDLTGLNSTILSSDQSVVSVGGGTSWIDIYRYLDSEELVVAGGRNGAVGIGGLTLGGGISHFTTRVGFACDNVVNYQVVLASGQLTNVNKSSNPDLYLALKGGATNFGIVTRFDLTTIPQGKMSINTAVNSISQRDKIFEAFTDITAATPFDPYVSLVSGLIYNSTSKAWIMSQSAVYTKPVTSIPPAFQPLLSVPSITNSSKLLNLSTFAAEPPTPPLNWLFWTGTYTASSDLMSGIFTILNDTLYDFTVPEGVVWSVSFEPLPTLIPSISKSKGGNVLGLDASEGNAFILLLSGLWPSSASNSAVHSTALKAGSNINTFASSKGMLHEFQYLNYADPSQSPLESYGASNLEYLRGVSAKYDPEGVFQKRVPGGFKLW